jgi:mycofactocin system glycosyltransferase
VLDPGARWVDVSTLVGGSPTRLLRLTPSGRTVVHRLTDGEPVADAAAIQQLVRRLLDAGLVHPRPPTTGRATEAAVVIPVRSDAPGLSATLTALERAEGVVVVDDASPEGDGLAVAAAKAGVTLVRRDTWGGPAGARNVGWRKARGPVVAFVDANCEPEPGWLDRLLPHFADPQVAAVAPRIVPAAGPAAPAWLAAYEAVASPLDLGRREAIVRPRSPVAYVPTAALVVRRAALEALDGFDERLPVGEDVDFVWRLVEAGWTVRYEPLVTVRHPIRPAWRPWLAQRYRYGTSAAPLARRHGSAVAPAVMSAWTAGAWGLAAAGHPALGAAAAGYAVTALTGLLPRPRAAAHREFAAGRRPVPLPVGEAFRLAGLGHLRGGLALARAAARAWAPAAILLALGSRRSRPVVAATVVVPGLLEWFDRRPAIDPLRFVALRLADDLSYCAGLWAGCARERSGRALLPDLPTSPGHAVRRCGP